MFAGANTTSHVCARMHAESHAHARLKAMRPHLPLCVLCAHRPVARTRKRDCNRVRRREHAMLEQVPWTCPELMQKRHCSWMLVSSSQHTEGAVCSCAILYTLCTTGEKLIQHPCATCASVGQPSGYEYTRRCVCLAQPTFRSGARFEGAIVGHSCATLDASRFERH